MAGVHHVQVRLVTQKHEMARFTRSNDSTPTREFMTAKGLCRPYHGLLRPTAFSGQPVRFTSDRALVDVNREMCVPIIG